MSQIWNIANLLTAFRIAIIPILVIFFYIPFAWGHVAATFLFILACLTDWIDGFLARRLKLESSFGAFLDPVADKLLVSMILILLVAKHGSALLAIPASVIVGREIVVSALRERMAELGDRRKVAVSYIAKFKTAAQMIAIIVLLLAPVRYLPLVAVGYVLIYLAAFLTLWTMMVYLKIAWLDLLQLQTEK